MKLYTAYVLLISVLLTNSCQSKSDDSFKKLIALFFLRNAAQTAAQNAANAAAGINNYDSISTYYSTMTTLNVQVVYESGAAPYDSTFTNPFTSTTKNVWDILDDNLKELFKNRKTSVTTSVPKVLSSMTSIASQNRTLWTTADIVNLAKTYRTTTSTQTSSVFFIAFVNGYYSSDGSTQNTNVIGVQVSGTPYIAIFKQVVTSTGNATPSGIATRVYVEQSTLVHEMGHALGLVNNGVTMTTSHQDTSNGKHCTDTTCVMYYANEGTSALVTFLQNYIQTGSNIMFKTDCLNDTQKYSP